MTPPEAYKKYCDEAKVAADAYTKYWLDKFAEAGIVFQYKPFAAGVITKQPITSRSKNISPRSPRRHTKK